MKGELVVGVDDLIGHPETSREFDGTRRATLRLGDVVVDGPIDVSGVLSGTVDGVHAVFRAGADASLTCVRCLTSWVDRIEVEGSQHFAREPDEDGYAIVDRAVDMAGPATDELALALPSAPLCSPGCKGLCPTCGSDLNRDPCDGHGDDSDSPFAALKDLLDP
ncbi:MAG: DUF177 domain-containing protein [Acidimicrobiia bacterium]